jgi:ketosteroid isomerase-like protein
MNAIDRDVWMTMGGGAISRRLALRGLGGAGLAAALAIGFPGRVAADHMHSAAAAPLAPAGDDPAALIEAYMAAVNSGDLEAILALHDDDAVHIFLPTPDGSAGVCRGKGEFRMWYEQSVANGDRVEVEEGSLAVEGNQAAFVARVASDPWRKLGLETLRAQTSIVLVDGRIMTHIATLTPESVRRLLAAGGTTPDHAVDSASLVPSARRAFGEPY